ncbi:MAG: hypothetical protein Q9213_007350 [Squamulea squamosa]
MHQLPSPSSLETTLPRGRRRKRSCSMEGQPRKRTQRKMNAIDNLPPQAITDFLSRVILKPKTRSQTSSPSRSVSPTRDLLNALRVSSPSVDCQSSDSPMAPIAMELRKTLSKDFGEAIIPAALKDTLRAADPQGFDDIPSAAFDYEYTGTPEDLDTLWSEIQQIHLEASECQMYNQDENAWAQGVARRVLSWCPCKSQFLQLKSIQSQSLERTYLPVSAVEVPVSKKADYALVYSPRDPAVRSVYHRTDRAGISLSQMTDTHTKRLVMAIGGEVKPAGGNSQEALAQLAIWFAAGFAKLRELQVSARARQLGRKPLSEGQKDDRGGSEATPENSSSKGDQHATMQLESPSEQQSDVEQPLPEPLPAMIGFTAVGHEWATYIACEHFTEDDGKVIQVTGPFRRLMASTGSFYEISKLLSLVERMRAYAQDTHWPELKERVLLPLIE